MNMRRLRGYGYADLERAAEGGPIPFTAATAGIKADGLNLQMDRLDLERFQNNPVVMYDHEYWGRDALPIGRAVEVAVDGDRLRTPLDFDLEDEFAAKVDRKIRKGYLNAVSIGFGAYGIDDQGVPERWELYEISVVPLPLDPDAIADPDRAGQYALARALGLARGPATAGTGTGAVDEHAVRQAIASLQTLLPAPPTIAPPTIAPTVPPGPGPGVPAAADRARRLRALEASL
ncbi:HK97 family phage prohead protease [Nonomuraea sp. NPDC003560]|uniref:HK97 family phage prohead protease n=1 Tax=Nonomuraea sp. NPDC003560 TaxID=3364341 RepID=UPI003684A01C